MLKKFYEKNEILIAIILIVAYVLLASLGDYFSELIGIAKVITFPILLIFSALVFLFIKINGLTKKYGFCKSGISPVRMLFYLPLIALLTANFWFGAAINYSTLETILFILSMFCVGFLEECIFRGFLFVAMEKNVGAIPAIIVSSVTFGIGHIVNLINGSNTELLANLLQVMYAVATGFAFVLIFYRTKSLIPCIITHCLFNSFSAFINTAAITPTLDIISSIIITVISSGYALYLALAFKNKKSVENTDNL
jgi:membrane protease YdiL (CAAX protease family)